MTYTRRLTIRAPRERVFDAVAALDGPRHWWTTIVTGSAAVGGELRFEFAGLDEQIVMRVAAVEPPEAVAWSCVTHSSDERWAGSNVQFELADRGAQACDLHFSHVGVSAAAVASGWDHFLDSLAAYTECGEGNPYRAASRAYPLDARIART